LAIKTQQIQNALSTGTDDPSSESKKAWPLVNPKRFSSLSQNVLLLYCLTAALSIAASQLLLLSLTAYWLVVSWKCPADRISANDRQVLLLSTPITLWFCANLLSALAGIDPLRSLSETIKTSVFLLLPFIVYSSFTIVPLSAREFLGRIESYVVALLLGQSLAAIHTVAEELLPGHLPPIIPGPLTESGQLVLVLPLVFATAFHAITAHGHRSDFSFRVLGLRLAPQFYASFLFMALLIVAWPGAILWEESSNFNTLIFRLCALLLVLGLAVPPLFRGTPALRENLVAFSRTFRVELLRLVWPASALLFAALLVNLKRGPWLGVFVELLVLGYLLSKRLLFWSVIISFVLLLSFSPARTRMANLNEHFSIEGGRKEMWELGEEIAQRFPLGLGTNNARYMRELDPNIPQTHRHMHNNFLNVLVETGWIGLLTYFWWMIATLRFGFSLWKKYSSSGDRVIAQLGALALCLSIALLGWQVSGMVEYNFGDGEIRLIALLYMGLLLSLDRFPATKAGTSGSVGATD